MKAKSLNLFEKIGLEQLLRQYNLIDNPENYTCGTTDRGLINFQNVFINHYKDAEYNMLGAIGLNEADYVIIQMWNEEGNKSKEYWCVHHQIDEPYNWNEFELE